MTSTPYAPKRVDAGPLPIAVIVASIRAGRFAPVVRRWLDGRLAAREDVAATTVDLADVALPDVLPDFGQAPPPAALDRLRLITPRLRAADAFVIVTPEYNHSFPASLKTAIDWHHAEWHAKPVAFVSYGGRAGGLRAVEHLRGVLAELHAVTIREGVSFHDAGRQFPGGEPRDPEACAAAADRMLDQLTWFGRALRAARAAEPYPA